MTTDRTDVPDNSETESDRTAESAKNCAFKEAELAYLIGERRLARVATVGADGTPHVVPVGWKYNAELDTIDVGGHDFGTTKKYKDVARSGRAAIVIDDVLPPGSHVASRSAVERRPCLASIHSFASTQSASSPGVSNEERNPE